MRPTPLKLIPGCRALPPDAVFLPGSRPADWLVELAAAAIELEDLIFYLIPRSRADRAPRGALVVLSEEQIDGLSVTCHRYRLRAGRLYLPVDAELAPSVDDAEIGSILLQDIGVFHPVVGLVGFGVDEGVTLRELVDRPTRRKDDWGAAKPGVYVPERLHGLELEAPSGVDEILRPGQGDIGAEDPKDLPPDVGERPGARSAQWTRRQLARGVRWLRPAPKEDSTPEAKDESKRSWWSRVHRWADDELQAQDRARQAHRHREVFRLLSILKDDPDEGLRFALPVHGLRGGGEEGKSSHLAPRDVDFDLSQLDGTGPADVWNVPADAVRELSLRYRELANRELVLGRHRRAAYIFAELLGDFDAAAEALRHGKHYREAGVLFRDQLDRPLQGARCFERAGLWEEALDLYERGGDFETAGDMADRLGRAGEAARLHRRAAERCYEDGDIRGAARIIDGKLGEVDEALSLLEGAWPWSPQAELCLEESYGILGRMRRHGEARQALEKLKTAVLPSRRAGRLAKVLAQVAARYPSEEVRRDAADVTRVVVAREIDGAEPEDARQLAAALESLAPEDRLLESDVERFLRPRIRRARRAKSRPRSKAGPRLLRVERLPQGTHWRVAVAGGPWIYVAGDDGTGIRCVRLFWPGGMGSVGWDPVPAGYGELLLSTDPFGASGAVLLPRRGSPLDVLRFPAAEYQRIPAAVGTPPWVPGNVLAIAYGEQRSFHVVRQLSSRRSLATYGAAGHLVSTHDLPADPSPRELWGGRVLLEATPAGVHVGLGQRLLRLRPGGRWETATMLDHVLGLAATPRNQRPGIVLSFAQGGSLIFSDESFQDQCPFALGLTHPILGFTRAGELIVVTDNHGLVYEVVRDRLVLFHEFDPDVVSPIAVLSGPEPHSFAVVTAGGEVRFFEVEPDGGGMPMSWWVITVYNQDPFQLLCILFWVPFSVVLHELGHGVAALWEGDDTPRRLNRMTLDPLVHMGGMSLFVFLLVGIAWGVMPVNPYAFRHRRFGEALVAVAGPVVNLLLALVSLTALALVAHFVARGPVAHNLETFLMQGGRLNLLLLLFNLLPAPPLDGAGILGGLSRRMREIYAYPEVRQYGFFIVIALLWFGGGEFLWGAAHFIVVQYLGLWGLQLGH